jgi:aryl-alcohol dehydrogenase-like predicted oxidoreductase
VVYRPHMRKRRFGRTNEQISELALGTWGLTGEAYGAVYHKEVDRVIDRAAELGITVFETADVYQKGEMEKKLGARLDKKEHWIVTKIGTFPDETPPAKKFDAASLAVAFDKSRERIGRDKLDVVLLHNPSLEALGKAECTDFLKEKVKKGELRFWGVSCGSADVVEKAVDRRADVVQVAYNLFHQRDLHRVADKVAGTDTAVFARSVLAHGLLAGHWTRTKVFFDNDHRSRRWSPEALRYRLEQLDAIRTLVGGDVLTLRAAAVRFVLMNEIVSSAVLGPKSFTQLNQLVHEVGEGPPYLEGTPIEELGKRLEAVGIEP